jgi:hypothetical protein
MLAAMASLRTPSLISGRMAVFAKTPQRGDRVDRRRVPRERIQTIRIRLQQCSHRINERIGTARACAVHAPLDATAEVISASSPPSSIATSTEESATSQQRSMQQHHGRTEHSATARAPASQPEPATTLNASSIAVTMVLQRSARWRWDLLMTTTSSMAPF